MAFSAGHTHDLLLELLGIADVKRSVTSGNINKPLKILVQLDALTCCSEVELSLTEEFSTVAVVVGEAIVFLLFSFWLVSHTFSGASRKQDALVQRSRGPSLLWRIRAG